MFPMVTLGGLVPDSEVPGAKTSGRVISQLEASTNAYNVGLKALQALLAS